MEERLLHYEGYVGTVVTDDGGLSGHVVLVRDVVTFEGIDQRETARAFRESVDDYLTFCLERGEEPEPPR